MLKFGTNNIGKVFYGANRIVKAYYGRNLVYIEGDIPSVLPEGYTRLEYIENPLNNDAWLNTDVVAATTTGFVIDFMSYDELDDTNYGTILGGAYDTQNRDFRLSTYTDTVGWSGFLRLGTGSNEFNAHLPSKNTRFKATLSGSKYSIGEHIETVTRGTFTTYKIGVFALYWRNAQTRENGHGRLYSLKMYDGNTILVNYIPCKNPNDVVGVYDTVNDIFTASANATPFVAGPTVSNN